MYLHSLFYYLKRKMIAIDVHKLVVMNDSILKQLVICHSYFQKDSSTSDCFLRKLHVLWSLAFWGTRCHLTRSNSGALSSFNYTSLVYWTTCRVSLYPFHLLSVFMFTLKQSYLGIANLAKPYKQLLAYYKDIKELFVILHTVVWRCADWIIYTIMF